VITVERDPVMQRTRVVAAAIAMLAISLAACGDSSGSDGATGDNDARTVEVDMVDTAFEPGRLEVNEGDTVRFVFMNRGKITHDAFIGDADTQADHESEMRADEREADHGGGHGDAEDEEAVTVEPGDSEALTHTFDESGTTEIGCHQEGHYDAGMSITIEVT
jgi:uncharacterized cupredoxin-like copper-binding protein